jgi:hypothetical protein
LLPFWKHWYVGYSRRKLFPPCTSDWLFNIVAFEANYDFVLLDNVDTNLDLYKLCPLDRTDLKKTPRCNAIRASLTVAWNRHALEQSDISDSIRIFRGPCCLYTTQSSFLHKRHHVFQGVSFCNASGNAFQ